MQTPEMKNMIIDGVNYYKVKLVYTRNDGTIMYNLEGGKPLGNGVNKTMYLNVSKKFFEAKQAKLDKILDNKKVILAELEKRSYIPTINTVQKLNSIKYMFDKNDLKEIFSFDELIELLLPYLTTILNENFDKFKSGIAFYVYINAMFTKTSRRESFEELYYKRKNWEDEGHDKFKTLWGKDGYSDETIIKLIDKFVNQKEREYMRGERKKNLEKDEGSFFPLIFTSKTQNTIDKDNINDLVNLSISNLQKRFEKYDSGATYITFSHFDKVIFYTAKYEALAGSSYIKLPKWLETKKALVNVKNEDNKCFMWAVLSGLHPVKDNNDRVTKYVPYANELNFEGIEFPVKKNQYKKIEKQNDFSFNVYTNEENIVVPLYLTSGKKNKHINLFLINDNENNHYCLVKNMSRLLSSQVSKHDGVKYFCEKCLCHFTTEEVKSRHEDICLNNGNDACKVVFPEDKDFVEFKNHKNKLRVPFAIYADCEALLKNVEVKKGENTNLYQKHEAYSFGFKIVSEFDKFYAKHPESKNVFIFKGENCIDDFLKSVKEWGYKIKNFLEQNKTMIITPEQEKSFRQAEKCHICEMDLKDDRVRDHCHITGLYRGASHNDCNINFNYSKIKTPVVFHNLKRYDSHFLIPKLGNHFNNINCIPKTVDEYITFSCDNLKFLDSFGFLSASLDSLSSKLTVDKFKETKSVYGSLSEDKFKLLTSKGIYPYDYFNNKTKFTETKLPSQSAFFNKLNDCNISDEDYQHAQKVYNTFECKTLGDYHDLYLRTDVLLLADVMENFRNTCIKDYTLDPFHYITLPGFSWDACLKQSKVKLQLIKDIDMYLMVESGIRGGISVIMNRFSQANNKYMGDNFDKSKPSKYIWYVDANNLKI